MAWTDEQKEAAKQAYLDANPTAENSSEIVKEIAEDMQQSPNGVRMILIQAGVYVKKTLPQLLLARPPLPRKKAQALRELAKTLKLLNCVLPLKPRVPKLTTKFLPN